jgi:hypothetical protein
MNFDTPRESAETIMKNWGLIPINYDNVQFDSKLYDEWARVTVASGDSFNACIGANIIRNTGLVIISLFNKQWSGSAETRDRADEVAALFNGVVDNGVVYLASSLDRVGHATDYYQLNLSIPYQYDA